MSPNDLVCEVCGFDWNPETGCPQVGRCAGWRYGLTGAVGRAQYYKSRLRGAQQGTAYAGKFFGVDVYTDPMAKLVIEFLQSELDRARRQANLDIDAIHDLVCRRPTRTWKLWKWGGA